jgi:hypothetical protein
LRAIAAPDEHTPPLAQNLFFGKDLNHRRRAIAACHSRLLARGVFLSALEDVRLE